MMIPQHIDAQVPVWDGAYAPWTQGSGTQADPYLIEIPQHLSYLARQVNNGTSTYNGVYFRLTSDLDMNSLQWTPIGKIATNRFKGNFDGDGHFIDNIYMSMTTPDDYLPNCGLFGVIEGASVLDLGVRTTCFCNYKGPMCAGGIAAYTYGGTNSIINCYHLGNISFGDGINGGISTSSVYGYGGIVGYVNGETTLTNCHNYGQISYKARHEDVPNVGGLIGKVNAEVTVSECSNSGVVECLELYSVCNQVAGGLIGGSQNGTINIVNSHNDGNVTSDYCGGLVGKSLGILNVSNSYNTGILTGRGTYGYVGGLVGSTEGNCIIANSNNTGNLTNADNIGGLVGYSANGITITNSNNKGSVTNYKYGGGIVGDIRGIASLSCCSNRGTVSVNTSSYAHGGGIIGYANYPITLNQCYNTAAVSGLGTNTDNNRYVGGLVGYLSASANDIHECYNTGSVSTGTVSSNSCGGIVGNSQGGISITNCYNTGTLTGPNNQKSSIAYGTATITNCYYLETCGGSAQTGAISKTASQMQSTFFPGMLNNGVQAFVQDVPPYVNQGYPIFGDLVYAVSTQAATNVGVTKAMLHGYYAGGADVVAFQYRENTTGSDWTTVNANIGSPVSYWLTGLQGNTSYAFRFMLQKNGEVYYGDEMTFTTGTCNLTANVTPSSVNICEGASTTLTASAQSSLGNFFTYSWNTGASTSNLNVSDGGLYTVTVSDTNGCSATASANVVAHPQPVVGISGNTYLCMGQSSLLTASGGSTYAWNTGATTPSIPVSHGGTYSVTATNSYGCSNSASVTVTSLENLGIAGNTSFCNGQSTTLSVANGTGSYLWSTGATASSIPVSQEGLYIVTVTLPNGCSSSVSAYVNVAPTPTPTILGSTTICQGQTTTLTANGGNSYLWSNGSTTNSVNVSQSGVYTVTATNAEGCSATTNVTITVNPLPNVNITGNSSFCQGDNVTLTASGASTYAWSNSQTSNTITVNNAGTYTVTGTDANGCTNTTTKTVSINPTYNIPLSHSICEGESYNFYGQNITMAGTYTHTLQTVNGCDSLLTLVVTLKALPTTAITGSTALCEGESTTLTANGGVSYVWSNGNTSNNINVTQSGVYAVTATNAEGCSASTNVTVTVNPLPNVNITGNSSFCQGDNTTLTATGASTYAWSNSQSGNAITVSNAGTYTVTGTDANGCTNTATKTISVNPTYNIPLTHSICQGESYNFHGQNITAAGTYTHTLQTVNGCDSVLTLTLTVLPQPNVTITGNTSLCEGQSTVLTANGGVSYAWSNASTNNSISVAQSGVYTVTATNVEGCTATATATVTVNPLPIVVIGGNTTICEGGNTTLTASGADTYSWSTGDNTASATISAFGIYNVTGTSAAGCSSVATVTVLVSQLPVVTITGETDICAGESTTLTANGGTTYLWSNGNTNASLTVGNAGTYQVIGYNEAGCNAMSSATVNVWQPATSEFSIECPDSCYTWNGQAYCATGDYTQTLQTIHGCDSVVTLHLTITVGVDDYDRFDFKVYPNPTSNIVNVECIMKNEEWGGMELHLVDAYGRLLDVVETFHETSLQTAQIDLE